MERANSEWRDEIDGAAETMAPGFPGLRRMKASWKRARDSAYFACWPFSIATGFSVSLKSHARKLRHRHELPAWPMHLFEDILILDYWPLIIPTTIQACHWVDQTVQLVDCACDITSSTKRCASRCITSRRMVSMGLAHLHNPRLPSSGKGSTKVNKVVKTYGRSGFCAHGALRGEFQNGGMFPCTLHEASSLRFLAMAASVASCTV